MKDINICFLNHSLDFLGESIEKNQNLIIKKSNNLKNENEELNYIFLKEPIFNPLYIEIIKSLLEKICFNHYKLYNEGRNKSCIIKNCRNNYRKFKIDYRDKEMLLTCDDEKFNANRVYDIFSKLDESSQKKMGFINFENIKIKSNPCDLILYYIPVIPKYIRPSITIDDIQTEDILTLYYDKILNTDNSIEIYETYKNIMIKSNNYNIDKHKSIIQRLSSKQGIFRNNILGKRTRLCGRSVITPDIFLKIDEIGIPTYMANMLLINNRKLRNNDYVLFIRHPTLQKMSVMSMKVKVQNLTYSIKMNPALCKAYNADFDGDEMNIFCLSNYKSISEAIYVNTPLNSIISPQNNEPIIYPSQDCISGLYILTRKSKKISKKMFYNCLNIVNKNIKDYENIKIDSKVLFSLTLPKNFNFIYNNVNIKNGFLINGYIDKKIVLKIIKTILDVYNKYVVFEFIYNIQLIINEYLRTIELSIGYDDCFTSLNNKNKLIIKNNFSLIINNNNSFIKIIDSGSKGSNINILQILLRVGQQYIRNKKIEKLFFLNDDSYCYNSFSNGLNCYEYFYHSQSGREGVINTNIRTPSIGYMQRQLSKYLEELIVDYNGNNIFNKYIFKKN